MLTRTQLNVLRTIVALAVSDPNHSVRLEMPGLSVDQLSDVLAQLVRLGCLRHYFDLGDGEITVIPGQVTKFGRQLIQLHAR